MKEISIMLSALAIAAMICGCSSDAGENAHTDSEVETPASDVQNVPEEDEVWSEEKIISAFTKSSVYNDSPIVACTAAEDAAYDLAGVVLCGGDNEVTFVFVDRDGLCQTCVVEDLTFSESTLTYLGNGSVVADLYKEDGTKIDYQLNFSRHGSEVYFKVGEAK